MINKENKMAKKIIAYKAFNDDMTCRDFQYEVGKTYNHAGDVSLCSSGFHACLTPFDCYGYYENSTVFAKVELEKVSKERSEDSKVVAAKITIIAQLTLPEWIHSQVDAVIALCRNSRKKIATGDSGHAAATGYSGHAAATGKWGHAAATGDSGHAAATGDRGHAAATGKWGISCALGMYGRVKSEKGNFLVLTHYDINTGEVLDIKKRKVDGKKVKADTWYKLDDDGKFIIAK